MRTKDIVKERERDFERRGGEKMKKIIFWIIVAFILGFILWVAINAFATQPDKITWCHCEPNGNCETLELPQQALEQAGHVDANGNILHAGDHAGVCEEEVTPTPTIVPCDDDCITPTPPQECEGDCEPTVTPTPTIPIPSASPTPENNPPPSQTGDGRSSGGTSTPTCTIPIDAPLLQGYTRVEPTRVTLKWWKPLTSIDNQHIVYGYSSDQLVYGVNNIGKDTSEYTINDLEANRVAFFQVWAIKEGCVSKSQIIDP